MANVRKMNSYVECGDFEGAMERYQTTTPNWKKRWWNALTEIYNCFPKWAQKYILDPLTMTIRNVTEKVQSIKDVRKPYRKRAKGIEIDCPIENVNACGTYVVEHYLDGERVWLKVGKAKNLWQRMVRQLADYAKDGKADSVIIRAFYPAETEEEALSMENLLRHHYKQDPANGFVRQDRFVHGMWTPETANVMAVKYADCQAMFG